MMKELERAEVVCGSRPGSGKLHWSGLDPRCRDQCCIKCAGPKSNRGAWPVSRQLITRWNQWQMQLCLGSLRKLLMERRAEEHRWWFVQCIWVLK